MVENIAGAQLHFAIAVHLSINFNFSNFHNIIFLAAARHFDYFYFAVTGAGCIVINLRGNSVRSVSIKINLHQIVLLRTMHIDTTDIQRINGLGISYRVQDLNSTI